jgi:hypothetical protein
MKLMFSTAQACLALAMASAVQAQAQSDALAGDYACAYGCRLTDAYPNIAINGSEAACMNEYGGLFRGRALSRTTIFCFNKIGVLQDDGDTIRWTDGVIWKRLPKR